MEHFVWGGSGVLCHKGRSLGFGGLAALDQSVFVMRAFVLGFGVGSRQS